MLTTQEKLHTLAEISRLIERLRKVHPDPNSYSFKSIDDHLGILKTTILTQSK